MTLALTTDETLLGLKVAFLVLLYVFVWIVVRTATRNVTAAPQESIVLSPAEAAALRAAAGHAPSSRLLVASSPALTPGATVEVTGTLRLGRGAESDLALDGDATVSGHHATLVRRSDGLWVEDNGSTNGTFVNGARVTTARLLQTGDVVRVGHTDLVVEP